MRGVIRTIQRADLRFGANHLYGVVPIAQHDDPQIFARSVALTNRESPLYNGRGWRAATQVTRTLRK
jgi:hypothetical protein